MFRIMIKDFDLIEKNLGDLLSKKEKKMLYLHCKQVGKKEMSKWFYETHPTLMQLLSSSFEEIKERLNNLTPLDRAVTILFLIQIIHSVTCLVDSLRVRDEEESGNPEPHNLLALFADALWGTIFHTALFPIWPFGAPFPFDDKK